MQAFQNTVDELARLVPADKSSRAVTLADKAKEIVADIAAFGADTAAAVEKAVAEVRAEFDAFKETHAGLSVELETANSKLQDAERLLAEARQNVESLTEANVRLSSTNSSLISQVSSLQSELASANARVSVLSEEVAERAYTEFFNPDHPVSDEHTHAPAAGEEDDPTVVPAEKPKTK